MGELSEMMTQHRREFARAIQLRKRRSGLTWAELAARCGVHVVTAQRWGSGERTPSAADAARLDKCLNIKPKKKLKKLKKTLDNSR